MGSACGAPHGMREAIALAAIVAVVAAAWWGRGWLVGAEQPSYLRQYLMRDPYDPALGWINGMDLVRRLGANLREYGGSLADVFVWRPGRLPSAWRWALSAGIAALIAIGWSLRARRGRGLAEWIVVWHGIAVLGWPEAFGDARFLVPILPMLARYLIDGVSAIGPWCGRVFGRETIGRSLVTVALAALLLANAIGAAYRVYKQQVGLSGSSVYRQFLGVQQWLAQHSRPGDVILSRKPTITALLAGRQAICYPFVADPSAVMEVIERYGVDYVIIDSFSPETPRYLLPTLRRFQHRFESDVVVIGQQAIVRVLPQAAAPTLPGSEDPS